MANKIDVLSRLSTQQREALEKQNELAGDLYTPGQSIVDMRRAYERERAWWNDGGPHVASEDLSVPTRHGSVLCRFFRRTSHANAPVIFYIHGGGFALGSVNTHSRIARVLAKESGATVVSIDYTLSPEAKYPQAIEECVDVVAYVREHGEQLGCNASDVSFAGDSGGANMSMGVFLALQEAGLAESIRSMILIYGWFGLRDSMSIRRLGGPWDGLTESDFQMYKDLYFENPADEKERFVDILGQELKNLPPAYIVAAQFDPLKDDSRTLASIYDDLGIRYEFVEVPGVIHGFIHHGRIIDDVDQVLTSAATFFTSCGVEL
ncbi:acetyl esterase [Arcanobacterium haemolyticum]|uniref:Alpha/beta hydrolase fold-3 domain protein n=1 Tax=Arcanobacterium haemolyticum (strain ATCC 9345 / DSM 20595 / CCM 5947 / CCUG 17215 / LMG 16163 / NBRC 15585 / NCTC 8452 / 11018) TaxID=644284 RepID=D7BK86_ARCHD|nr:acetyl esterase [Arcanobacterium haemolyticum]ADH93066.1 Alpha/beta hydrolase fold-3 domain protein [Arcanobacterium haemolyticum DSM 20595]SQH28176.1 Acetyl esterase [Arcanobacterium haemolyticum]